MTFSSNDPTYMQRQMKEKPSGSKISSLVPRLSCFQLFIICSIEVESEYTFTHGTDILDPAFSSWGKAMEDTVTCSAKMGRHPGENYVRFTKC